MNIDCFDCPLRRSPAFLRATEREVAAIARAKTGQLRIPARAHIIPSGARGEGLQTLLDGWACRYMEIGNGRRQIVDIHLPGDLIGLQGYMTGHHTHAVQAITNVVTCLLDARTLHQFFAAEQRMTGALITSLLLDEQRAETRLLMLGRQRPTERLSFLLLQTRDRLIRRGWDSQEGFEFPLTYQHLADALGLSRSQVASSLKELRDRGWATLAGGLLTFEDAAAMANACRYRPAEGELPRLLL